MIIKIKGEKNLGNLVGPWEAAIADFKSWSTYCDYAERMVNFMGPEKMPDDVIRMDVDNYRAYLEDHFDYSQSTLELHLTAARSFYTWMIDFGFASTNPFKPVWFKYQKPYKDVFVT